MAGLCIDVYMNVKNLNTILVNDCQITEAAFR